MEVFYYSIELQQNLASYFQFLIFQSQPNKIIKMNSSHFTGIETIDIFDSQFLQEYNNNSSKQSQKKTKFPDVNTPINVLLQKIQVINNKIQQKSNIQSNSNNKLIAIRRQGRIEDQPPKHTVLNSSLAKKNRNKSEKNSPLKSKSNLFETQLIQISKNKEHSALDSNFYKYWTDQIVRLTTQNSNIEKNLQRAVQTLQIERKKVQILQDQNTTLSNLLKQHKNLYHQKQKQYQTFKQKYKEQCQASQKLKLQLNILSQKIKIHEVEINKYQKIVQQKQKISNQITKQLSILKFQSFTNMQYSEQNKKLTKRLGQVIIQNKKLQSKLAVKSEAVDHLWSIKQIQYSNIVQLIAKSKHTTFS